MFIWLTTSFDYYLIQFLVNTFDQVYISAIASSISDILSYIFGGYIYSQLGTRATLALSYGLSTLGGLVILAYGLQHQDKWTFAPLVILAKFGISCTFNILILAH